jgi:hypothetical protein
MARGSYGAFPLEKPVVFGGRFHELEMSEKMQVR